MLNCFDLCTQRRARLTTHSGMRWLCGCRTRPDARPRVPHTAPATPRPPPGPVWWDWVRFGPTAQPLGGQGCAMRARGKSSLCVSAEAGMYRCVCECREALKRTKTSQLMYLKDAVPPGCLLGRWGKRKAVDNQNSRICRLFWHLGLNSYFGGGGSFSFGGVSLAPHPTRPGRDRGRRRGASLQLLLRLYKLKHRSQ